MLALRHIRRAHAILFCAFAIFLAMCAAIDVRTGKHIDFSVYWFDVHGFLQDHRPLYGTGAVMGFPMIFRYPPVFVPIFYPLARLPFLVAGGLWAILEVLGLLVLARWLVHTLALSLNQTMGLTALVLAAPYVYLTLKDGNMQWFVTVLTVFAITSSERYPRRAGFALALGASIKIWPILFIPLFFSRERRRALLWCVFSGLALCTFPIAFFGGSQYSSLLHSWYAQEFANHTAIRDIWYPSQSLRGLLLRYCTDPAKTLPYRTSFADVHLWTLPPAFVVAVWLLISAFALLLVSARSIRGAGLERTRWDFLYFVTFSGVQPYCNWSSLITLTPAILLAAHYGSLPGHERPRLFLWCAAAVSGLSLVASLSRSETRLLQTLGIHFLVMLCIGASLLSARPLTSGTQSESLRQKKELSEAISV